MTLKQTISRRVNGVYTDVEVDLTGDRLAEHNAAMIKAPTSTAINSQRDKRIEKGTTISVTGYGDVPMTGRSSDQSIYLAMLLRAQGAKALGVTAAVHVFRDAANIVHNLTPDQVIEMVSGAMTWFESVMKISWAMKDGTGDFMGGIPLDYADDKHWP